MTKIMCIFLVFFLGNLFGACASSKSIRVNDSDGSPVIERILSDKRVKEEIVHCRENGKNLKRGQKMRPFPSGNFCERGEDGSLFLNVGTRAYTKRRVDTRQE